jgi:hypothetical protein
MCGRKEGGVSHRTIGPGTPILSAFFLSSIRLLLENRLS